MIFCLYRAFLENSLSKQNLPSPHVLAVYIFWFCSSTPYYQVALGLGSNSIQWEPLRIRGGRRVKNHTKYGENVGGLNKRII